MSTGKALAGPSARAAGRGRRERVRRMLVPALLLLAMAFAGTAGPVSGPPVDRLAAIDPGACGLDLQAFEADGILYCTVGPEPLVSGYERIQPKPLALEGDARKRVACVGDGSSGPRIQPLYVYEVSKGNRYAQFSGTIGMAISGMDQIFSTSAQLTGGVRKIRFVTVGGCAPVVGIVSVPDGSLASFASSITAVRAAGYNRTDRNYAMFVDTNVYCGIGTIRADSSPSQANLNNLGGAYARVDTGCWSGFAMAHEIMHGLGAVQLDAPHSTGAWHCTDERDVMCYSDQGANNPPMQLVCNSGVWATGDFFDCNHDDYFDAGPAPSGYLATHWNTADSVFLDSSGGQWPGVISLSPESGPVGTPVTVSLSSLQPGAAVQLLFDASVVATKVTDGAGAAKISFTVPKTTAGYHIILADTADTEVETVFKVTPSVRVKPKRARAGTTVDLLIEGFGERETVAVRLDGKLALRATTRVDGSLETALKLSDQLAPRQHNVTAVGSLGNRAQSEVTIKEDRSDRQRKDGKRPKNGGRPEIRPERGAASPAPTAAPRTTRRTGPA